MHAAMPTMTRDEGITIARRFREAVLARGYPVQRIVVFGSVARDEATEDSDLDIAVICEPFAPTRVEENLAMRRVCRDIDVRIEPFCLHEDDFENKLFAIPFEVRREGIDV
jgi:predicted nucleotidyltransferase